MPRHALMMHQSGNASLSLKEVSHLTQSLFEPVLSQRRLLLLAAGFAGIQQRLRASRVMSSAWW
jgi:hypothetical protein